MKFKLPRFAVPQRLLDTVEDLMARSGGLSNKLRGLTNVSTGDSGFSIVIENPFREFEGHLFPAMRSEFRMNDLADASWVPMMRTVLLFMVVLGFILSVIIVLRQY